MPIGPYELGLLHHKPTIVESFTQFVDAVLEEKLNIVVLGAPAGQYFIRYVHEAFDDMGDNEKAVICRQYIEAGWADACFRITEQGERFFILYQYKMEVNTGWR